MAATFAVVADSEQEARDALQRMCDLFGLEPTGPPSRIIGRDKWMGRARAAGPRADYLPGNGPGAAFS